MSVPTRIARPCGVLARVGALMLAGLLVMTVIAGCAGFGSERVENVFDEVVLTSPARANECIFGCAAARTPTGFERHAPGGTDPQAGKVVDYECVASDLGDPWEESGLAAADGAGEDPREASLDVTADDAREERNRSLGALNDQRHDLELRHMRVQENLREVVVLSLEAQTDE
jgi:hypothetical protein